MATEANTQSFWEHLDVLRAAIIKIVAVAVVFGIVVFFFKEQLFGVVLVPKDDGFITYQLLNHKDNHDCLFPITAHKIYRKKN